MGLDWAIPQGIARKQVRNGKRCYVKLWYMREVSAAYSFYHSRYTPTISVEYFENLISTIAVVLLEMLVLK